MNQSENCPHCGLKIAYVDNGVVWLRNHQPMECVTEIKRCRDLNQANYNTSQQEHILLADKYEDALRMIVKLKEDQCPITSAPSAESVPTASSTVPQASSANTQRGLSEDIASITTILRQTSAPSA
jgi:hypothetical protein